MSDIEPKARAVIGGVLQFVSVSQIKKADPHSKGCLRSWFFRYVCGTKDEDTLAKQEGRALHKELCEYSTTGTKLLSSTALKGLHMVPEPGPGISAEHVIGKVHALHLCLLKADGTPVIGAIDLLNTRGTNKGTPNIEDLYDPPGTVEVQDHKYHREYKADRFEPSTLLHLDIQMAGYGKYSQLVYKDSMKHLRLSHSHFFGKGKAPFKQTWLYDPSAIDETWWRAERVVRDMKHAAGMRSAEHVTGNTNACGAFGGCKHRLYCTAYQKQQRTLFYGDETVTQQFGPPPGTNYQPAPGYPAYPGVPLPPMPMPDPRQQLEAEAAAARAAAQQQQQVHPGLSPGTTVLGAWQIITQAGRGTPALSGEAAAAVMQLPGFNPAVTPLTGSGQLQIVPCQATQHLFHIAAELLAQARQVPQALPPTAPASHPQLAAQMPVQQTLPAAVPAAVPAASEAPKRRGRKPKAATPPPMGVPGQPPAAPDDEDAEDYTHHLQFLTFEHLKPELQGYAKPFADLANWAAQALPSNPELGEVLRLLRRAKDHAITAVILQ